ncbi:unnamed protein product [Brassica oleracea]
MSVTPSRHETQRFNNGNLQAPFSDLKISRCAETGDLLDLDIRGSKFTQAKKSVMRIYKLETLCTASSMAFSWIFQKKR